jgi:hypothetical protein
MVQADGSLSDCSPGSSTFVIQAANGPLQVLAAIEFYHAALDHYFITSDVMEIADLDNGVHAGWIRTGQSFNVFAPAKSGGMGNPVCRFYGLPSAGLDSHFSTVDANECAAIPTKFNGAWTLESADAFDVAPPPTDFECPSASSRFSVCGISEPTAITASLPMPQQRRPCWREATFSKVSRESRCVYQE